MKKDDLKSKKYYEERLEIYRTNKNIDGQIRALNKLGLISALDKNYNGAIDFFDKCLKLAKKDNDVERQIIIYKNLGKLSNINKDYVKSLRYHEKALKLIRKSENALEEARKLKHIGFTHESSGDYKKARDYYKQSLEIYKEIDSEESQYGVDRINTLIENLDEVEKELDEEEYYLHKFGLTYDKEDFF